MQAGLTFLIARRWIDTSVEKELGRARTAVPASVEESRLDLPLIHVGLPVAGLIEVPPEHIEPAYGSGALQV
jgi:hypothetical protein